MNTDYDKLLQLKPYVKEFESLAKDHGIRDIFQDNQGKLLELLLLLGLKVIPGRNGNDAIDEDGVEYEIKTLNINRTKSFSTNHHLNLGILDKYRKAKWIFAVYDDIDLKQVFFMDKDGLQVYYDKWEEKLNNTDHINNPKISLSHVQKFGECVYDSDRSAVV